MVTNEKNEKGILHPYSVTVCRRNRRRLLVECHFLLNSEYNILELFVKV
jgi:hypothetical protein